MKKTRIPEELRPIIAKRQNAGLKKHGPPGKQSAILPEPPAAFPKGWHWPGSETTTLIDGQKPKRGGKRPGAGRAIKEVMCPWCGKWMATGEMYSHPCVHRNSGPNLIAFFLRKAWLVMQTLPLNQFSYGDSQHLPEMAICYNNLTAKEAVETGSKKECQEYQQTRPRGTSLR